MNTLQSLDEIKLNMVGQIALAFIVFIIVVWLFGYIFSYAKRFIKTYKGTVTLLPGLKNADTSYFISNNPKHDSYMEIPRAFNEDKGVTFTYNFWMLIDKWSIRQGKHKHVFNKGSKIHIENNDFEIPLLNAPGCYLDKTDNNLLVYMNTFDNPGEHLKIPNIPINKWVAITITLDGQILSIYKNGYLQKTKTLKSYPRQNNSPIRVNDGDGYSGFISKLKYYNYSLSQSEIESYVKAGPTDSNCLKDKDVPGYMSTTYIENMTPS